MTVPTFLVIGAARAGSTALVDGLRTHPQVFVTQPKEPHFFALHGERPAFCGPGDDHMINRVAITDPARYLALYPGADPSLVALGDGSVSTMYYHQHAIPEIRRLAPTARFVAILRDPVERALSAYDYLVSRGFETAPSLLEAVALEPERIAAGYHHLWHYVSMGLYADSIAAFQQAFGADRLLVVFQERLSEDYAPTVARVLRFLGTDEWAGENQALAGVARVNTSGESRSRLLSRGIQAVAGHPALRTAVKKGTSFAFRERVRTSLLRRHHVAPEVRAVLAPEFADDLRRLGGLLAGQDLPLWITRA